MALAQRGSRPNSRWSLDGGRDAARQIGGLDSPLTAVYAEADIVALGMMSELWDGHQTVSEAYSLMGHINSRTSSLGLIRLTTTGQAGVEMGKRVGHLLGERIEGRSEACHDVFENHGSWSAERLLVVPPDTCAFATA